MKFIAILVLTGSVGALGHLLPRATGDKCKAPEGQGKCLATRNCKGISYTQPFCPNDPEDIQCCVEIACKPPGRPGLCRNVAQGCPNGSFNSGNFCPGDQSIQCCVENDKPKPGPVIPSKCTNPAPNTCDFYADCLESRYHCGSEGYPMGFGDHFCKRFQNTRPNMTPAGQQWLTKTMQCLQRKLVPFATGSQSATCPSLRSTAFETHSDCYVDSGVCTLDPSDWAKIFGTVDLKTVFNPDSLRETLETVQGCAQLLAWIAAEILGDLWDDLWPFR